MSIKKEKNSNNNKTKEEKQNRKIEKKINKSEKKDKKTEAKKIKKNKRKEKKENSDTFINRFLSLFRFNITFKLTLGFLNKLIICMVLLNIIIYMGIKSWMYVDVSRDLEKASKLVEENYIDEKISEGVNKTLTFNEIEYYLYDKEAKNTLTNSKELISYNNHEVSLDVLKLIQYGYPKWFSYETFSNKNQGYQTIILRKSTTVNHEDLDDIMAVAISVSLLFILLLWIASVRLTKKHLRPIKIMTEKVQDISVNNLDTRLNVTGTKDELKDLAKTFNEMMNEIEKAYEQQRQFVSDASHELRTPIAVIKGYASMVNRWGKDDENVLEESIQAIEEEAKNMQSLVESLLFLASRDKGNLAMEKIVFNIKELVDEIVKETGLIDSEHQIQSNIEYEGDIYASPDKLKQAVRIFIDNSIRYTEKGKSINIDLRASQKDVYVVVKDQGIGIAKENIPNIFERFYREDQARTRSKSGGSGLGLAIAKVIIEQHNGKINVESEIGEGTTITIIIPKSIEKNKK